MSRAVSGISESRMISVPLIRTVADRTVRSVRTSLSAGSDLDTSLAHASRSASPPVTDLQPCMSFSVLNAIPVDGSAAGSGGDGI
jgi:hypothetical protein